MTVPLSLIGFLALLAASVGACLALLRLSTGQWGRGLCWCAATALCAGAFMLAVSP